MDRDDMASEKPNVHVRLLSSMMAPGLPKREGYIDIWMKGTKFRVRDETGRYAAEILGDIASKRGLGQAPHTIEEIMDIWSHVLDETDRGVTELIGDIATNRGLIHEHGQAPWTIEAEAITSAAKQIFTDGLEKQLELVKTMTRFGRTCTEYHGFVEGEDDGVIYNSEITRIISPPFVFLNEVHDAEDSNYYYIREFVDFEEGKVTNADVEPLGDQ